MAISFNQVFSGILVPGAYTEFDTSKANQGAFIQQYSGLIVGQKLAAGTKPAGTIDIITSEGQARAFYGAGSMLFHQVKAWLDVNKVNELSVFAYDDAGGSVKAAGSIEPTAVATGAGTIHLRIGDRSYNVAVADTDTANDQAVAIKAAIDADPDRHVDAGALAVNVIPLTYRHGGEAGNDIDIRFNHFQGEEFPASVAMTVVAMSGGTGNPTMATAITEMGEKQYHSISHPYSDAANLALMKTEMDDRWGPIRQNDGQQYICRKESHSAHLAFMGGQNSEHTTFMNVSGPTPSFVWSAVMAAQVSQNAQTDPARPLQTLPMSGITAPKDSELFPFSERQLTLAAGSSTFSKDSGGTVRIERLRTARIENAFAAPDPSLSDLNPKLTLSYLRFDWNAMLLTKYPRHKLADDGTRFGPGQAVMTPNVGRTEAIARFRLWEELGLVEGADQFKRDLIVERNAQDPNRLDYLLPPDLINQLRVSGSQIGFLL